MNLKRFSISLLIIKFLYLLFGHYIFSSFSRLGDTERYLNADFLFDISTLIKSTFIMDFLGGLSGRLFGDVGGSLPFCLFSFLCIIRTIKLLNLSSKQLIFILLLLVTPSFCMWTSIASKECIVSSFAFLFIAEIYSFKNKLKYSKSIMILCYYVFIVFKPQYLTVIIPFHLYIILYYKYKLKIFTLYFILPISVFTSLFITYYFRDFICDTAHLIATHFNVESNSTRDIFYVEQYDFFTLAPIGTIIALWGPTIHESLQNFSHMIAFFESNFLFILIFSHYLLSIYFHLNSGKLNFSIVFLPIFVFITFSFVHYPFGIMNPGSAIRYRSSFLPFFFLVVFLFQITRNRKLIKI